MDYLDMLKRGWAVTWDHKYLWVLGFIAALGGGSVMGSQTFGSGSSEMADVADPAVLGTLAAGIIAASCIGIILAIVFWLIGLAARGGMIQSVANYELGKPVDGFGGAFRMGWRKVWSLAGLSIVLFGIVFLIGLAVIALLAISGGTVALLGAGGSDPTGTMMAGLGIAGLCLVGLMCLLIPLFIVLNFIYAFAMRGLVLRDLRVMDAIRHGWQVLRDNLGPILMLSVAFLIFNIIAWLIGSAILLAFGLTIAIPTNLLANTNATFMQGLLAVIGAAGAAIITALVAAVLVAWQSATFTIAYMQFTGKSAALAETA